MMDSVLRPRKSILISPVSSITEPSYCVTSIFSLVSLSSAVLMGTTSDMSVWPMITPQACTPVLRTFPSSMAAYLSVSFTRESLLLAASLSSGTLSMAVCRVIFFTFGILSGTSFASRFDSERGSLCTLATSLIEDFVAMVP